MGYNLHSACHHCRERITHLRGKEGITLQAFHLKHLPCLNKNQTLETISDYAPLTPFWLDSEHYSDLTDKWWAKYFPETINTPKL